VRWALAQGVQAAICSFYDDDEWRIVVGAA
jgi:hypothetical protein